MPPTLTLIAAFWLDVVVRVASLALNPVHGTGEGGNRKMYQSQRKTTRKKVPKSCWPNSPFYSRKNCEPCNCFLRFSYTVLRGSRGDDYGWWNCNAFFHLTLWTNLIVTCSTDFVRLGNRTSELRTRVMIPIRLLQRDAIDSDSDVCVSVPCHMCTMICQANENRFKRGRVPRRRRGRVGDLADNQNVVLHSLRWSCHACLLTWDRAVDVWFGLRNVCCAPCLQ